MYSPIALTRVKLTLQNMIFSITTLSIHNTTQIIRNNKKKIFLHIKQTILDKGKNHAIIWTLKITLITDMIDLTKHLIKYQECWCKSYDIELCNVKQGKRINQSN